MSSNDLAVIESAAVPVQAFARQGGAISPHANVGAIAIEQERAIAEVQGKLILAKRFRRSMTASIADFLDSCASPEFAEIAFYSVPNRGSGESIRFAEEAARCYGNFEYGHRELSRSEGKSEIEVFAWDMENNNYSKRQITVMHVRDKRGSAGEPLKDQADIDNRIANVASKQMRGRILALLPKHMVAAGVAACKRTLAGGGEKPMRDRLIAMAAAFGKFGVNDAHLSAYLGHPVDATTVDELGDLMGIYNNLREGGKPSDFFGAKEASEQDPAAAAITAGAKAPAAAKKPAEAKAEPKEEVKTAAKEEPKAEAKAAEPKEEAKEVDKPAAAAAVEPAKAEVTATSQPEPAQATASEESVF